MRRIGVGARHRADVVQSDQLPVQHEIHAPQVALRGKPARNPYVNVFLGGPHDAGRRHGVLRLQGAHQCAAIDNEAGCLLRRDLQIEALVLRADDIDLVDVLHQQQARAHALHVVAQFAMREAVGDDAVDDRVGVAELVIEGGADDPLRQRPADVVDLLADLVPDARNVLRRDAALEGHSDRCAPRNRIAGDVVHIRRFLDLLFDLLGDLKKGVGNRCARPLRLNDHVLHGEGRIFGAAETAVRPRARRKQHDHDERDERTMVDRPFREIEGSPHDAPESSFTFCPGCRTFTPAVTTTSPSRKPFDTITAEGS